MARITIYREFRPIQSGPTSILGVALLLCLAMALLVQDESIGLRRRFSSGGSVSGMPTETKTSAATLPPSYSSYRPKTQDLINFTYMEEEFISPVYVPYDTVVETSSSPYELRWPEEVRLPEWATKVEGYWNKEVPKGKHVCYCSVGKAAGSSVSGLLGFQLHAPDVYFIPPGLLPHYTTHIFHKDVNNCADDMPFYLFTLRHPLERIKSAFRYDRDKQGERPQNRRVYKTCKFSDLNTLAVRGLASDGKATEKCKTLAHELVRGSGHAYSKHMFFNYHYYLKAAFTSSQHRDTSQILAIRTEHMERDWNAAERVIRDDDDEATPPIELNIPHLNEYTPSQNSVHQDYQLTTKAQVLLCEALCEEILIYKQILREAVNLRTEDFEESMNELAEECPLQVYSDECV